MPLDQAPEPDSPLALPTEKSQLLAKALQIIGDCRSSSGIRAAYARQLNSMIETGRQDGARSLINMLHMHIKRAAAHIYSAGELRFAVDFENDYPKNILERGARAARLLDRDWERNSTDLTFGQGVVESLKYGSCFLKQWVQQEGVDRQPVYYKGLVMPWQFGVYNEYINELSRQPALCETFVMTLPEVWRRIYHLPNAKKLFERIVQHSQRGEVADVNNSFFHQVLSTATINTGANSLSRPVPGGIVQLNNDPNYAIVGPEVTAQMVMMHELWVWNENDYATIQVIEPDILISPAPGLKLSNLLISGNHHTGLHPYDLIQANREQGYIWGRSEVVDLIEPQGMLSTFASDVQRLTGLQIDKILGFSGYDGLTDENYDQTREGGFFNMPPGAEVKDLTPAFPPQALEMINMMIKIINMIGGFDNILSGGGESGVRAGVHAETLLKTASPSLRDRALLVERQCAGAADKRLSIMEAKDNSVYWTDGTSDETIKATSFSLHDIPEDRRVVVDGHTTSPIFADDHKNLIGFGLKAGIVDGHYALKWLPFPDKDVAQKALKEKEANQAKMVQELIQKDPEGAAKALLHQKAGAKH